MILMFTVDYRIETITHCSSLKHILSTGDVENENTNLGEGEWWPGPD